MCCHGSDPKAIVAADQMVTVGQQGGVEYEDAEGKVDVFVDNDNVSAVAVGAGITTYIDDILRRVNEYVSNDPDAVETARDARDYCLGAYQNAVRETVENTVFQPLGYTLSDLRDEDVRIPGEMQRAMVQQIGNIRQEAAQQVNILVAAVDNNNAELYQLHGMDASPFTDIGYSVIGSGADSARLAFTRRGYERTCTEQEGVFTVLEAKSQAEERQGVGQKMDFAKISKDSVKIYEDEEKQDLREMLDNIKDKERDARQKVIEEWDESA